MTEPVLLPIGSPKRGKDESFDKYKQRRKLERGILKMRKAYGHKYWPSSIASTYRRAEREDFFKLTQN